MHASQNDSPSKIRAGRARRPEQAHQPNPTHTARLMSQQLAATKCCGGNAPSCSVPHGQIRDDMRGHDQRRVLKGWPCRFEHTGRRSKRPQSEAKQGRNETILPLYLNQPPSPRSPQPFPQDAAHLQSKPGAPTHAPALSLRVCPHSGCGLGRSSLETER